jgi:hypothetical protein
MSSLSSESFVVAWKKALATWLALLSSLLLAGMPTSSQPNNNQAFIPQFLAVCCYPTFQVCQAVLQQRQRQPALPHSPWDEAVVEQLVPLSDEIKFGRFRVRDQK